MQTSIRLDVDILQERIDALDDLVVHFTRYARIDFDVVMAWDREDAHSFAAALSRLMKAEHPAEALTSMT